MKHNAAFQCDGKHKFTCHKDADQSAKRGRARGLEAYRCPHCHGWHIGHAYRHPGRPKPPPPAIELEA